MKRPRPPVACLATIALVGCATVRSSGTASARPADLDRAELARCMTANARAELMQEDVAGLAGAYRLHLFADAGTSVSSGSLELWPAPSETTPSADPLAGPAADLAGVAEIDLAEVGATPGGDPASREPEAPGVALYRVSPDLTVVRLGAESNRRDRQRFNGAHTTLTLTSFEPGRFGGTWRSDMGADSRGGEFCAVRVPA